MRAARWITFAPALVLVLLFMALPHNDAFTYSKGAVLSSPWRAQLPIFSRRTVDTVAGSTTLAMGAQSSLRDSTTTRLASTSQLVKARKVLPLTVAVCSGLLALPNRACLAQSAVDLSTAPVSSKHPAQTLGLWAALFTLSALLHSAECAITKISPWKVQQFAETEGEKSAFATLSRDLTRLLVTILLTTTACSIYSTALFVSALSSLFPNASLASITAALTALTLLVGEVIPKAVAVGNSEVVARTLVPPIARLASLLRPITSLFTVVSDFALRLAGLRSVEDKSVSEDMLRRVVDEAEKSGAQGILQGEGRMIKAVLDMQDKEVGKIMRPRVEIVGVEESATALDLLDVVQATNFSRVPVYRGDVDHIVGVALSRSLLPRLRSSDLAGRSAAQLMEPAAFVPPTMSCWAALQEMRRRQLHMLIVVDEYGGTAGLVTLEDILEQVVGDIFDEADGPRLRRGLGPAAWPIARCGHAYRVQACAELDDVCEALGLALPPDARGHSTLGGLLCDVAGRIPEPGDVVEVAGLRFEVERVEGGRKLVDVVVHLPRAGEGEGEGEGRGGQDAADGAMVFQDGCWRRKGGLGAPPSPAP